MNLDSLSEKYGLSKDSLKQMLGIFVKTTAFELGEIENALDRPDFKKVADLAHKLKTSFLYFELNEIASKFQELNQVALSGLNDECKNLVFALKAKVLEILKQCNSQAN